MTSLRSDSAASGSEFPPTERAVHADPDVSEISEGAGLCLSGGGFRAMLFHVGVLKRLNEDAWLPRLERVSSVSGGSITAGLLGLRWDSLEFTESVATNFDDLITHPLRTFAHTKVDVPAVAAGGLLPFVSISDRVVAKLEKHLFGETTLQDLPDAPRFVINATNLESGVSMRFSKPYLADYKVGMIRNPTVQLADAVAASSAFPPFLSPFELDLSDAAWEDVEGNTLKSAGYRSDILLSDGGVYDNMGLEPVYDHFRTVLVSDAGGHLDPDSDPERNWGQGLLRVLQILDSQIRAQRRRALVDTFTSGDDRSGFFISTISDLSSWPKQKRPYMSVDTKVTRRLAAISTRLNDMPDEQQEMIINWGFAAADAGLLRFLDGDLPLRPWPYPDRALT